MSTGRRKEARIGLCLCGGGITGAMYEVGCLAALEEAFADVSGSLFDVFVGASSGATVALTLAGGYRAQRLYRALLDPADDFFPLQRHHLLRLDALELKRVASSVLGSFRRTFATASTHPFRMNMWHELDRFYDSLPAGLFTVDAYERFLSELMARRAIPNDFDSMPRELVIVAADLDAGERATFGLGPLAHVPVVRAVAASSAVPVLYAPVRIGERDYIAGGVGAAGHVDVAADRDCDLVVVINAAIPVRVEGGGRDVPTGQGPKNRVRDKGLLWVYNQSFRMVTAERLREGLETFQQHRPDTDVVLVEPYPNDTTMFMYSPMNFDARREILQSAYRTTMRQLRDPDSRLRATLERALGTG